jgi:RHS repeat-associated protein
VETFDSDFNGNVTQVTDRRGKVTVFTYDSLNRRTGAKFGQTGPSVYESTIDYVYDKADRVRTVTDSLAGMLTLNYDDLDRLAQEISPEGTVGQTYDAANRRRLMTISGLADTTYDYDGQNRLKDITRGTAKVTFDYVGTRRSRLTLPNGVMVDYTWEGPQLKGLTYKKGTSTLGDLVYGYDSAGNRTRLGGAWARTGLPDAITGATYNEANQQQTLGSRTMGYDPAGNLKTLTEPTGTTNFTWDARGQLAGLTTPDTTMTFLYDGLGRRRAKIVNATRTDYLYDGLTPVRELQGTATANLLTGPGIDEYFTRTSASGTRTLLPDALGSIVALTDDAGAIQSEYTYEPFGLTTETGADGNPFQFTGRENDTTGLYYYRARYYHPGLQRFISEDPLEFSGGDFNLYGYVDNSPVNFIDPFGLDKRAAGDTELPRPVCRGKFQSAAPDYNVFNLSFLTFGPQAQVVLDRYGRVYVGAGVQVGKAAAGLFGLSGYGAMGNLDSTTIPSRERLDTFLGGLSINWGAGALIFGRSRSYSPGNGTSTEHGVYWPQIGAGAAYSKQILEIPWLASRPGCS